MEDRSLRRTNILRTENLLLGVRCHRWPFDLQVALISPPRDCCLSIMLI